MTKEYLRYSGLAFQMIVIILLGLWIGQKLDQWVQTSTPVFTVISVLTAIIGSLIVIIINASRSK